MGQGLAYTQLGPSRLGAVRGRGRGAEAGRLWLRSCWAGVGGVEREGELYAETPGAGSLNMACGSHPRIRLAR